MMLASPVYPSAPPDFSPRHNAEDSQYRPARDLESFNSLLPPPIEFVEGSSTGTLAIAEGKYEPINASPKPAKFERREQMSPSTTSSPVHPKSPKFPKAHQKEPAHLYPGEIDMSWPPKFNRAGGLYNGGNTCFLNSALQCLLHTPPLLRIAFGHTQCPAKGFCMVCAFRAVAIKAHSKSHTAIIPDAITTKLQAIAKHLRRGRQEDSHEFLRYAIDGMQKACLAGYPPKIDPKLAETTWVHKIFGGQLRSRVTCESCGYNSDTFDSILDLSLDIHRCGSLKDALRKFVAPDHLKGADKYKCDKCKKHVNAEKRFSIHRAPNVLTVHLKRFSPFGNKIGHPLSYDENLVLKPYMSEGQHGPAYSLYGVICHAGGGPNSGHYYAFVKDRQEDWFEMNDESVSVIRAAPVRLKNAYILFYIRNKGGKLESAVNSTMSSPVLSPPKAPLNGGVVAGMKRRKASDDEEDRGVKVSKPFIGPVPPPDHPSAKRDEPESPSPAKRPRTDSDPQADMIKRKIAQATSSPPGTAKTNALSSLGDYQSDREPSDDGDGAGQKMAVDPEQEAGADASSPPKSSSPARSPSISPVQRQKPPQPANKPKPIPAEQFYSSVPKKTPNWMNKRTGMNPLGGGRLFTGRNSPKKRIRPI